MTSRFLNSSAGARKPSLFRHRAQQRDSGVRLVQRRERENAPVVVLTTSETATTGVLAVLSYTTVTGRDVATVLASLGVPRRHVLERTAGSISVPCHPKPNPPIHRQDSRVSQKVDIQQRASNT